jgi:hypothetical protein
MRIGGYHHVGRRYTFPRSFTNGDGRVEDAGTFGTLWASLGMSAYFMALTWINILLGLFLTPLFLIPLSWLKSRQGGQPD